jgi:DNA gyrase subunit A
MAKTKTETVVGVSLYQEVRDSYLSYSLAIFNRSLPDCVDGLKQAQRRVILGLRDLNLRADGPYKKVSRLEGHVLGSYHPQGGCANTAINMGQSDAFRYPLTDIHGNVGGSIQTGPATGQSLSEDPPAAARYLEVRGTPLVERMFTSQINSNYGEWRDSYDGSNKEVVRLVPPIPSLLINGSQGIASGYACYHIPYHITDVVNATLAFISDKDITPSSLRGKFTGPPDFAQGGRVVKDQGLKDAMDKGQGAVKVYGTWEVIKDSPYGKKSKRDMVIITSLPHGSSEKFLDKVHSLVEAEKLVGIVDASDHSSRDGIRVQLVLKPGTEANSILPCLLSGTNLCHTHNVNATAITEGLPVVMGVKEIISEWYGHRKTYLKDQFSHEISVINTQIERFSGVLTVLGDLDKLVGVLKKSKTREIAHVSVQKTWKLTPLQATEVLNTPLSRLVGTEIGDLKAKIEELEGKKTKLTFILSNEGAMDREIMAQVTQFREFSGNRRAKFDQISQTPVVKQPTVAKPLSLKDQILKEGKEIGMTRTHINEFINNRSTYGANRAGWDKYKDEYELRRQLTTREGKKYRKEYLGGLKDQAEASGMAKRGKNAWGAFMRGREKLTLAQIRKDLASWPGIDSKPCQNTVKSRLKV